MNRQKGKLNLILLLSLALLATTVATTWAVLLFSTNTVSNAFTFVPPNNVLVYYEKYGDESYGFYHKQDVKFKEAALTNLQDNKTITEAGYGVLSNWPSKEDETRDIIWQAETYKTKKDIRIKASDYFTGIVEDVNYFYPVSQTHIVTTGAKPLKPLEDFAPYAVDFDGLKIKKNVYNAAKEYIYNETTNTDIYCISNFAKGVYDANAAVVQNYIRTPEQMRNITTPIAKTDGKIFTQELTLDFAKNNIGGADNFDKSLVDGNFKGTYKAESRKISNVNIVATTDNIGVFSQNSGKIEKISLTKSNIKGNNYVGGIVGQNLSTATITSDDDAIYPKDIFLTTTIAEIYDNVTVEGKQFVGGITGQNIGNIEKAKVKDNITIKGNTYVGGIAGSNSKNITYPQVYGTFNGNTDVPNDVNPRSVNTVKIMADTGYAGGIAGQNITTSAAILGSDQLYSPEYDLLEATRPTVGGYVQIIATATKESTREELTGSNVGGVTGYNQGKVERTSVHAISIRDKATSKFDPNGYVKISGTGNRMGGLVGYNDENATILGLNRTPDVGAGITIESTGTGIELTAEEMANTSAFTTLGTRQQNARYDNDPTGKCVGGIAGKNRGIINQTNIRDASGDVPFIIKGAKEVGGIVGSNGDNSGTPLDTTDDKSGMIGIDADTAASSVHGNIIIEATKNSVGGIVGRSYSTDSIITNAFVYDYNPSASEPGSNGSPQIKAGKNPYNYNQSYAGGIVGNNYGQLNNCAILSTSAKSTVVTATGGDYVGGLVGYSNGEKSTVVENCAVLGNVEIKSDSQFVGGIAGGQTPLVTLTNCKIGNDNTLGDVKDLIKNSKLKFYKPVLYNNISGNSTQPKISGSNGIGGFVGLNNGTVEGIELDEPINITASGYILGGIVATNQGTVSNCLIKPNAPLTLGNGNNSIVGGIVGQNTNIVKNSNVNISSTLLINASYNAGGIVGFNAGGTIDTGTVNGNITIQGLTTVGGCAGSTGTGGLIKNVTIGDENFSIIIKASQNSAGGILGENAGLVEKCTVQGNVTMRNYWNPENATVEAVGGIVGKNISGAAITDCTVKALATKAPKVYGALRVGGIVGQNADNTTLARCYVIGGSASNYLLINGGGSVGGILGDSYQASFTDISVKQFVEINGEANIGGILGLSNTCTLSTGIVENNVKILGTSNIGGIVGNASASVSNGTVKNNVTLTGGSSVGGIVGVSANGEISASNVSDTVTLNGANNIGGIVGSTTGTITNCNISGSNVKIAGADGVGGIVGVTNKAISTSTVTGSAVINGANNVGGIVGKTSGTISNCSVSGTTNTARGIVKGTAWYVGGIVGNTSNAINDCNVTNLNVTADTNAGGIVGRTDTFMNRCIINQNVTITATSLYAGGLVGNFENSTNFGVGNKINNTSNSVKAISPQNNGTYFEGTSTIYFQKGRVMGNTWAYNSALPVDCTGTASIGTSEGSVMNLIIADKVEEVESITPPPEENDSNGGESESVETPTVPDDGSDNKAEDNVDNSVNTQPEVKPEPKEEAPSEDTSKNEPIPPDTTAILPSTTATGGKEDNE